MIVIDAGHGGTDPGTSGSGIIEKNYTLDISLYMAELFRELGIPVTLTRTTDEALTPDERVSRIMNAYGNNPDVIVISNHLNAGGGDGAEVIYALRNNDTLSRIILEEIAKEGQNVRKWYQRRLPSDTSKDYYFIHRNTGVTEPVIVEYGFVDNAADAAQIKSNWRDYTEAVVRAVAIYKGIPYGGVVPEEGYVVQSGDTLWSIARKFGVSVNEIRELNNLTSNLLRLGQVLRIPGVEEPTPVPPSGDTYIVQRGDSLWSIANRFGITVNQLRDANNLTTDLLSLGQVLQIPTVEEEAPTLPIVPPSDNTYTVQRGDSLWSIANKFGVSVNELKNLNNLTTDLLSLGQVLLLPASTPPEPTPGTVYTVVSGDSLYSIANRFGTTVDAIRSANNLTSNLLSIGQTLIIPTTGGGPTNGTPPSSVVTYTVSRGDNLYSIASRFGTTAEAIRNANNLTSNLLSIGQTLTIPTADTQENRTYTVQRGDSLWSIANRFGKTVNQLRNANNLTTDLLSVGQVLQIP